MNRTITEIIGWYGALALMGAYTLLSFNVIASNSFVYQILNMTGALGIVIISLSKKTYQPAVLNIIWAAVALIALFKIMS